MMAENRSNTLSLQNSTVKELADYVAPDGSEIRLLPQVRGGGFAHCTLPQGKTSLAVCHKTVEEIWFFLTGKGEVWRRLSDKEITISVSARDCLTIPTGCHFQFRNCGTQPLTFLIATIPPWPGPEEAFRVMDHW